MSEQMTGKTLAGRTSVIPGIMGRSLNGIKTAAYIAAVGRGEFAAPVDEPLGISPAQAYGDDEYLTHSINAWFDLDESLPGPWVDVQIGDSGPRSGTRAELLERDPELVAIIARFLPDSLDNLMEGCSGQQP